MHGPDAQDPVLSVLIPSYNTGQFIAGALESATNVAVERIVMDGASEDGTIAILRSSGAVWRSEADKGQSDALNKAITMARGEWIGWLNADERYIPGALEDLLAVLPTVKADVVYGDF